MMAIPNNRLNTKSRFCSYLVINSFHTDAFNNKASFFSLGYRANVSRAAARGHSCKRTACTLTSINVSPRFFLFWPYLYLAMCSAHLALVLVVALSGH